MLKKKNYKNHSINNSLISVEQQQQKSNVYIMIIF